MLETAEDAKPSQQFQFGAGTTDESKQIVMQLVEPSQIFYNYRIARSTFKTGDLVLQISEQDPSFFEAGPRSEYVRRLRELPKGVPLLMRGLAEQSAHKVAQLPFESDAMWLVVVRGLQAVPVTCVLFAVHYEMIASA